ncbi:MAG: hypothetical protein AB7Q81_25670 [Gammaproteobacteria bacterium]
MSLRTRREVLARGAAAVGGLALPRLVAAAGAGATTPRLPPIGSDPIAPIPRPGSKSPGLSAPSYIDPFHRTPVFRITSAEDMPDASFVRHDYSRRQAFNGDNSRFVAKSSNGYWLLYDGATFLVLRRGGHGGSLRGMAGDAEAIWHPTDPRKLCYTGNSGSLVWYEKDVESDHDTVMVDFRGRLPWPKATAVWTKGEGVPSANGRFWGLMATSYDESTKKVSIHGLLCYDRQEDRIVGTLDAARFDHAMPDHVSMSPSGRWVVPSWAFIKRLGTRAYTPDFSTSVQLHSQSEHSDLAIGPDGDDMYVVADYDSGQIRAVRLATAASFDLMPLYPARGSSYAAHISGKAYDRPGWVVVSTYADSAGHGKLQPDPVLQPMHRRVMLVELRRGGRQLGIAHTRTGARYGGYQGEPQATISRDGSRVVFASNFDDGGGPNSYLVTVPGWAER